MPRSRDSTGYVLFINLRHAEGVARLFQVIARAPDEYYGLRPVKGGSTKLSLHSSGQSHISVADGERVGKCSFTSARPDRIVFSDTLWFVRVEGPESLLPYEDQPADQIFEVNWDCLQTKQYVYSVEIALGREFDLGEEYLGEGYLVQEARYQIPVSESGLSLRLQLVGTPSA